MRKSPVAKCWEKYKLMPQQVTNVTFFLTSQKKGPKQRQPAMLLFLINI